MFLHLFFSFFLDFHADNNSVRILMFRELFFDVFVLFPSLLCSWGHVEPNGVHFQQKVCVGGESHTKGSNLWSTLRYRKPTHTLKVVTTSSM